MALAYSLTINGSILVTPVVSASNPKINPLLGTEQSTTVDAGATDVSLGISVDTSDTYTGDTSGASYTDISDTNVSPTDHLPHAGNAEIDLGTTASITPDTYDLATGAATSSDIDAVSTNGGTADLDAAMTKVLSVEVNLATPDAIKLPLLMLATSADDSDAGYGHAGYSELTSFSLAGTLLYEDGAIASTTTNGNNANEFVLNAGTPLNATLQTGELNLVSNTALYSYFGLAAPNLDVVNLSSTVDPVTGMEDVSITFDPSVADAADYNFFYPFLESASLSPANTIEITGGEMLLTFSADSFMVEGSINVYGTDGTTDYLYSAELFGSVVSGYVGFAETGPPGLS